MRRNWVKNEFPLETGRSDEWRLVLQSVYCHGRKFNFVGYFHPKMADLIVDVESVRVVLGCHHP